MLKLLPALFFAALAMDAVILAMSIPAGVVAVLATSLCALMAEEA